MGTMLSVRASDQLERALRDRAAESGVTLSELVRGILEEAVALRPLSERVGHLKGRLELPDAEDDWETRIRENNWRD